jgi:DNA-binding transcriptional LysR family regulator
MIMNLEYLRTYIEVIKAGSFSEVAKKLSISQPAVSFQIQKLEQELGVRLVDRRQKKLMMTEAGKRLLVFAELFDKEHQTLMRDFEHLREELTGNLVIAASTMPGDFILPPILGDFKKLHPAVDIQVEVTDSARVIEAVKSGEYDIGFCGIFPEDRDLEADKIAEDEIVLIVFTEHPFARRKVVSFAEVSAEPLIFREPTSGTQRSLEALLSGAGFDLSRCKPALVFGTTEAVITAVEAKSGIAFVSNLAIKKSVSLGLVKEVRIEGVTLKRDFFCIYRKQGIVSRLLEEFISFVKTK